MRIRARSRRRNRGKSAFLEVPYSQNRRRFLQHSFMGLGAFVGNSLLLPKITNASPLSLGSIGDLQAPDSNGVRLPEGFTSRVIARTGHDYYGYIWHAAPDGGATFANDDGGWIYVSNSELPDGNGGAGSLRFDKNGKLIDAYSILNNTSRNCAGGHTPWGTWLSCEEVDAGQVWECDPYGKKDPVLRASLGTFNHEAIAVDTNTMQLYLTEDKLQGCLYRYTSNALDKTGYPDLDNGFLEVAEIIDGETGALRWHLLPDPQAKDIPTREQVIQSSGFNGGEGIWFHQNAIFFTTKGDDRVYAYEIKNNNLSIIYNAALYISPVLTGVDNITSNKAGELLVAEDAGNLQIVVISKDGMVKPLLQLVGHDYSEITGPAFSPDGLKLYFSSQRGITGRSEAGITFEITGPF
jgi:secreted PhoX family phosphatase